MTRASDAPYDAVRLRNFVKRELRGAAAAATGDSRHMATTEVSAVKDTVVTFEQLQQAVGELSSEERFALWQSCPPLHPRESAGNGIELDLGWAQVLPEMLGRVYQDDRGPNAPGRRQER
jgi:hypothetical protein